MTAASGAVTFAISTSGVLSFLRGAANSGSGRNEVAVDEFHGLLAPLTKIGMAAIWAGSHMRQLSFPR